jgi:hypothetical protein
VEIYTEKISGEFAKQKSIYLLCISKYFIMENKDIYEDISSIKNIMERSTKFISLNGLSGVMAGVYALIGAAIAYVLIPGYVEGHLFDNPSGTPTANPYHGRESLIGSLVAIALLVLLLSITTGIWLTTRKARRKGLTVWNPSSRALLNSGLLPLLTGGCFILILLVKRHYGIIAPGCLVFYGLALTAASQHTFGDVKLLGISEVVLGLLGLVFPGYGLLFWALGFGVLHIVYGTIMYFKYDRGNNAA